MALTDELSELESEVNAANPEPELVNQAMIDMQRNFTNAILAKQVEQLTRDFEEKAPEMTADEIYNAPIWPDFDPTIHQYLDKPVGYVCQSPLGNMVKLIQPYDSTIYSQAPEDLPAQWGFYWAKEPKNARPFLSVSTSPYMKDEVCAFLDEETNVWNVWKSTIDNNVWSPADYPQGWENLGPYFSFL